MVLAGLVAVQVVLYVWCFAIPTFNERWPSWPWWWAYLAASVLIVLAEARIAPGFQWFLVAYIGQVSALPLRTSVPVSVVIVGAALLNKVGWAGLVASGIGDWFETLFTVAPFLALILFMGRLVATSAERGILIRDLEAAKKELEQARDRELELAALRERERLARDLHDNLGHSLVVLTVQLEAAQRLLAAEPARAAALLTELQKVSRSSMEDLRRSLANLRAPGLGDRPLGDALRALCADAGGRFGAAVECAVSGGAGALRPAVAEVLWRVAQEGLTNVGKHAQARHAAVHLDVQAGEVLLRVTDDGIGVQPGAEQKPGHYGLRGLRERVEGLGGTFTLGPAGSRGTVLEARVPVIA